MALAAANDPWAVDLDDLTSFGFVPHTHLEKIMANTRYHLACHGWSDDGLVEWLRAVWGKILDNDFAADYLAHCFRARLATVDHSRVFLCSRTGLRRMVY